MDRHHTFRPPAFLLLLGVAALGCASGQGAPSEAPGPETDRALEAWFDSEPRANATRASFHVSEPVYVAVFEVAPGHRVRALYPNRPLAAAEQHRFAAGGNVQTWNRDAARVESGLPRNRLCAPANYWLLVASKRPLDFGALGRDVTFRSRPGVGVARVSFQPHRAFETLVAQLLPEGSVAERSGAYDITAVPTGRSCA